MLRRWIAVMVAVVIAVLPICAVDAQEESTSGINAETLTFEKKIDRNKVTLTVGVKECNLQTFDIGIAFSSAEISVKNVSWADEFVDAYLEQNGIARYNVNDKNGTYVVASGAILDEELIYTGNIFSAEFTVFYPETAYFSFMKNTANYSDVNHMEIISQGHRFLEPVDLGDVDGDGFVTPIDALWCLKSAVGALELLEWEKEAADVDRNGAINGSDALLILQYVARMTDNFPDTY